MNKVLSVVAGVFIKQNSILICKRAAHKSMSGFWEFPGGKIEKDEIPEHALIRELKEEFGIIARLGSFLQCNRHQYSTFEIDLHAYQVKNWDGDFNPTDHDEIKWVEKEELLSYPLLEADIPIAQWLIDNW